MSSTKFEVVVINLKYDNHKRNSISRILSSLDFRFSFFDALRQDTLPERYYRIFYRENLSPWGCLLPGEIGCYASHIRIMEHLLKGEFPEPLVIMEDDAFPTENSIPLLNRVYDTMRAQVRIIDIVNMYQHGPKAALESIYMGNNVRIIRNYIPSYRAHCYMINRSGCKKFLENIDKITMPFDLEIIFSAITGKMHVWEVSKTIVGINPEFISESSIAPDSQERSVDRDEKFKYAYRRKIARQRYGMIHDMRYQISRKIWKLSRPSKP